MAKIINKQNVKRAVIVIGVIIIPLMYSYFYLNAFWNPYNSLSSLPVAVVNLDKGAAINEKDRDLGNEMCDELKSDATLKFVFTNADDARNGLENKKYYATLTIPESFSADVASASGTVKQNAHIEYAVNEKRNYLAAQILNRAILEIEEETRSKINGEIVQQLADELGKVPAQLQTLDDGLGTLKDGTHQLVGGAKDLKSGTASFSQKMNEYKTGMTTVTTGADTLTQSLESLDSGIGQVLDGLNKLSDGTANIDQISKGATTLASGAAEFQQKITAYTAGVDSLISSVESTTSFLTTYATTINPAIMKDPYFGAFMKGLASSDNQTSLATLKAANAQIKNAAIAIGTGAQQLSNSTQNLAVIKTSLTQLQTGLGQVKSASAQITEGSATLSEGLQKASDAATQLTAAAVSINKGAASLSDGAVKLDNGVKTAEDTVSDKISASKDDLTKLDGLSDFAQKPVTIDTESVDPVPNYGTAFTPYFIGLSLWVGGLIIFFGIYLDADGRFKILSRSSERKLARSFIYLLIGFAQAIILALVVKLALGLEVKNLPLFWLACCLTSMVFISIIQLLMVHLKDVGKFLSIALLILQLTSCGGTFPMETVPKFFNILYPFMPMTYSVNLMKEAISGVDYSAVWFNAGVLAAILVCSMGLTVILSLGKRRAAAALEAATAV